jgi:hypothetical protein
VGGVCKTHSQGDVEGKEVNVRRRGPTTHFK